MCTNDREGSWHPRSVSSKSKPCTPISLGALIPSVLASTTIVAEVEHFFGPQLADKWHETISSGEPVIVDVYSWLRKATLDWYVLRELRTRFVVLINETSIGTGGFGYDFGALENTDNKFTKSYVNLGCGSLPSNI
jgi:hypothetical protein